MAEGLDDFYDLLRIFALLGKKIPSGNRIAGVVNAGFESTVAIKELKNLELAQLNTKTMVGYPSIQMYDPQ